MTAERHFDHVLEEMWAIKRELAAGYPSLEAYFKSILDEQRERELQGVKFVSFPPRKPVVIEKRNKEGLDGQ